MTLLQLQYFQTVCKYKSFTKAANALHITQPGISTAMKELEHETGLILFYRKNNRVDITEQGQVFLHETMHLLNEYRKMEQSIALMAEQCSMLRIGVASMGGSLIFPKLRKGFHQKHPGISLEITEDSTEELYHLLDRDELDLILAVSISLPDHNYHYLELLTSRLLFCVHKSNPLAGQKLHSIAEIGDEPLVMLSGRYSQTKYLKRLFTASGYTPNIVHETTQVYSVIRDIRENAAAGFLPDGIAAAESEIIGHDLPEIDTGSVMLVWKRSHPLHTSMQAFIRFAEMM